MISRKASRFSGGSGGGSGAGTIERYFERLVTDQALNTILSDMFLFVVPENGTVKRIDAEVVTPGSSDVTISINKNNTVLKDLINVTEAGNGTSGRLYISESVSSSVVAGDEISVTIDSDGTDAVGLYVAVLIEDE